MKKITQNLFILLSSVFLVFFTSCVPPPHTDIQVEGAHFGINQITTEAQEINISVEVKKGDGFFISGLTYTEISAAGGNEDAEIKDVATQKEIKGPWFEIIIAKDMKSLKVKIEENTNTKIRELNLIIDNNKNDAFCQLVFQQAGKN